MRFREPDELLCTSFLVSRLSERTQRQPDYGDSFASAIALARCIRYFGVGYLAIRYGHDALPYLASHKLQVGVVVAAFVVLSYTLSRIILKHRHPVGSVPESTKGT